MAVLALRCPHCKIRFSINDTQVNAQGEIQCASCDQPFIAREHSLEPEHKKDELLIHDDMDEALIQDDIDESYLESLESNDDILIHDDMSTQPLQRNQDKAASTKEKPRTVASQSKPAPKKEASKKPLKTIISIPNPAREEVAQRTTSKAQRKKAQKTQESKTGRLAAAKTKLLDNYYGKASKPEKDKTQAWIWGGSISLLVFLILFQALYFNFHNWSRSSARPVYEAICAVVRCNVPPLQDVNLMSTLHLVVRTHPKFKQALMIDMLMINNAEFEQPFPDLLLVFRDNKDWVVASRRFKPSKYLSGELAGETMMPPQISIHISLEVLDPGPQAINYGVSLMANQ